MNWLLVQGINPFSSSPREGLLWIRKISRYLEDLIMNLITSILFHYAWEFSPVADCISRMDNGCISSAMARDDEKETHFDGLSFPYSHIQASHG